MKVSDTAPQRGARIARDSAVSFINFLHRLRLQNDGHALGPATRTYRKDGRTKPHQMSLLARLLSALLRISCASRDPIPMSFNDQAKRIVAWKEKRPTWK